MSHLLINSILGTLRVIVKGGQFPAKIFGKFSILCAIIRQLYLSYYIIYKQSEEYDVFFVDLLSACVPFLHFKLVSPLSPIRSTSPRILFYCHHPDQKLTTHKYRIMKLYRLPFDYFEEWSISISDTIVVNSKYTLSVFKETFTNLTVVPEVVYPCVNEMKEPSNDVRNFFGNSKIIVSINRFERKKNINLAVKAFSKLTSRKNVKLVIAGGYDPINMENVEHLEELRELCKSLGLTYTTIRGKLPESSGGFDVLFMPSVSSDIKTGLLKHASLLLYTPSFEHFGIVPLEAMTLGTPILAVNNGGPLETIDEGKNGWLREPIPDKWAEVIQLALFELSDNQINTMASYSKNLVESKFTKTKMADNFEDVIDRMKHQLAVKYGYETLFINLPLIFIFLTLLIILMPALYYFL